MEGIKDLGKGFRLLPLNEQCMHETHVHLRINIVFINIIFKVPCVRLTREAFLRSTSEVHYSNALFKCKRRRAG